MEDNPPTNSKPVIILMVIFIIAGLSLLIPGSIDYVMYIDAPKTDICENYIGEIGMGTYFLCSYKLNLAQDLLIIGSALGLLALIFVLAWMYLRNREIRYWEKRFGHFPKKKRGFFLHTG